MTSPGPNSAIKSSVKMISCIFDGASLYSVHTDEQEAEAYLEDLKLAKHSGEWDLVTMPVGRLKGEEKPIWGMNGCYDWETRDVIMMRRGWFFSNAFQEVDTIIKSLIPGADVGKFLWLTLVQSQENNFLAQCRKLDQVPCRLENGKWIIGTV